MKILFIQVEFDSFTSTLPWTYFCHIGMADALREAGHAVDFILSAQADQINVLANEEEYDLCIINDLVHGFASLDGSCNPVPLVALRALRKRSIPLVGVIIETIFHDEGERIYDTVQPVRKRIIDQASIWIDFIITYDKFDAEFLRDQGACALWTPFFSHPPPDIVAGEASDELVFYGGLYDKRQRFLIDAGVTDRVTGGYINYPSSFARLFEQTLTLAKDPEAQPALVADIIRNFKMAIFRRYAEQLLSHRIILNLPTIFKGIACRSVEAIVLARPSLISLPRHRDEILLLESFADVCIFYNENEPQNFSRMIDVAAERTFSSAELQSITRKAAASPFAPDQFAKNVADFVNGAEPVKIEQSYF